ncbi:uncharacterized protein BDZ99DRAFT_452115 [Mytilinidion resinicola]|uniref:Rhodopsin domain-containing protein n=1 Tax=Mytilinidion resinicola TaxID=574789 RepID=A0A6A6Y6B3_9PEZI|nr:uncharacterized protein BDZ99DRAFT_452115 [Mytilinidion resinicola]KAF2804149.1 hypothetical protein BDZ99DRAFT_452115 [Mytilinidion resinicola]
MEDSHSHPLDSRDDHRSLINVFGWFCVVLITGIILTRLFSRWVKSRSFGIDDAFILASMVLSILQTVAVSIGVGHGLGQLESQFISTQSVAQQKSIYAFTILFVLGQFFAKFSIISFIISITPDIKQQRFAYSIGATSTIWMASSVFGFAFQCRLPNPWIFVNNRCIHRLAFYTYVEVLNIVIDSTLAIFPSLIILGLQLELKQKAITIAFFMSRLLVVTASIGQLATMYTRTEDPFISWTFALLVTIIQTLGIITACGPYLRPFIEGASSGMLGIHDIQRRRAGTVTGTYGTKGSTATYGSGPKKASKFSSSTAATDSFALESDDHELTALPVVPPGKGWSHAVVSSDAGQEGQGGGGWDRESQSSRTKIIRHTTSYRVSSGTAEHEHA